MNERLKKIFIEVPVYMLVFISILIIPKTAKAAAADFRIISPKSNQLAAAGYIDICWSEANGGIVENYDLYVDNIKVTTTTETSYEYYTTQVSAHQIYVLANYTDGTTEKTSMSTFGISKKGLGLAADMGQNISLYDMGVAWYYNWGNSPSNGEQYQGIEYVPMVWKETDADNFKNRVKSYKNQGYKYVLTFNEPDLGDQCNMTVDEVCAVWQGIRDVTDIHIASPVTALWPKASPGWFQSFMTQIQTTGEHDADFITIHCYPENYAGAEMAMWFLEDIVDWTWETYHKPIWITEFSTTGNYVTSEATRAFWEAVMPGLDERAYVERYAPFGFNSASVGLWNYDTGVLTPAGEVFKNQGNPADFEAADPADGDYRTKISTKNTVLDASIMIDGMTYDNYAKASGTTAFATSEYAGNVAQYVLDDDYNTRWESAHEQDPQSLTLDLGTIREVKEIDLIWEAASALQYTIEVSENGNQYTKVALVNSGEGERWDATVLKETTYARYIKIHGIARNTVYGYSIRDIAVFGTEVTSGDSDTPGDDSDTPGGGTDAPGGADTSGDGTVKPGESQSQDSDAADVEQSQDKEAQPGTGSGTATERAKEKKLATFDKSAKVKVKAVTKKKSAKKVKVTLKQTVKGADGYQVRFYQTKKNAKKNKRPLTTVTVKKNKKSFAVSHKKLKNKKFLFIRVRAFVKVGNSKKYSEKWSAPKKVKIKK